MNIIVISILTGLIAFVPAIVLPYGHRGNSPTERSRKLVSRLTRTNVIVGLFALGLGLVWLFAPRTAFAAGLAQQASDPYASLAASVAVGLGSIAAGMAVSNTGSAAIAVIAEKPESFGRVLVFVGLAEGIAIYGLIIAFIILSR